MEQLGKLLWELVDVLKIVEKSEVECCGVTPYQGYLLMRLLAQDSVTMQDLAQAMGVALSTMTRNIDKLVEKEMVQRQRSHRDARVTEIVLTEKGQEVAQSILLSWETYFTRLGEILSEEQRSQVMLGLQTLLGAVKQAGTCC